MKLTTERLELVPLTLTQMEHWIYDLHTLEKELVCSYQGDEVTGFFADIIKGQLDVIKGDPKNYFWHSFWFMLRKSDRVVIGSADFKAPPNEQGEVEIGYGLSPQFEHQGYMTETVQAMCDWALRQHGVTHVIADTDPDNYASMRVLEHCGFKRDYEADKQKGGETIWWRL